MACLNSCTSSSTSEFLASRLNYLNTDCVEGILMKMTAPNVFNFAEACPDHHEAVNSYWTKVEVLNMDEILLREVPVLKRCIPFCTNLKEVKLTRVNNNTSLREVIREIMIKCPKLEVLDIQELQLDKEDLYTLVHCHTLKTLKIKCDLNPIIIKRYLQVTYDNNPHLENICIRSGCRYATNVLALPGSAKKVEYDGRLRPPQLLPVLNSLNHEVLEELRLPRQPLSTTDILLLGRFTMLKCLDIAFPVVDHALEAVFRNNPGLEDVTLRCSRIYGEDLRLLPSGMKRLVIYAGELFNISTLVEHAKTWKLETLTLLDFEYDMEDFIPKLVEAVPTLKHLTLHCLNLSLAELSFLQCLKEIRTLRLLSLHDNTIEVVQMITNTCVDLELLDLSFITFKATLELFVSIAALPKLKTLRIKIKQVIPQCPSVNHCHLMHALSKSESLTRVRIWSWSGFNAKPVMELIRECSTLTHLEISAIILTTKLLAEINAELERQKDRTEVLHIEVLFYCNKAIIRKPKLHRLLELNYVGFVKLDDY